MGDEKDPLDALEAIDPSDRFELQKALYKAMQTADKPWVLLVYLQQLASAEARYTLEATNDSSESRKWLDLAEAFGAGVQHTTLKAMSQLQTLAASETGQVEG
jgi:hypothetical protein